MREYNHLENRERPSPEDLTSEQVKSAVARSYIKGDCPECGERILQSTTAGKNTRRDCPSCGLEITT